MTIHVDFLTVRPEIYQYAKIDYAMNFLPSWYKNLPVKNYEPRCPGGVRITMKGCYGLRELFKRSLIIPLWSDVNIALGKSGTDMASWAFADEVSNIEVSDEKDYGSFVDATKIQHMKFLSPWFGFSKSGVDFCFVQPTWNTTMYSDILHTLPGVVGFKYGEVTNINVLLSRKPEDRILELKHGMPLVHLMPLTEEKVKIKHHLVDEKELHKRLNRHHRLSFSGWANKIKRLKDNDR